jgi:hypothetical protein
VQAHYPYLHAPPLASWLSNSVASDKEFASGYSPGALVLLLEPNRVYSTPPARHASSSQTGILSRRMAVTTGLIRRALNSSLSIVYLSFHPSMISVIWSSE